MPLQTIWTMTGRDVRVVSVQCDTQKLFRTSKSSTI